MKKTQDESRLAELLGIQVKSPQNASGTVRKLMIPPSGSKHKKSQKAAEIKASMMSSFEEVNNRSMESSLKSSFKNVPTLQKSNLQMASEPLTVTKRNSQNL